jgi:DNA-binding MurR/RpiR family transcriptional regulator
MGMGPTQAEDHIATFTEELLRTGYMVAELGANLVEATPADAYPGEEPAAVVIEMIIGSIRTTLAGADEPDVVRATELIAEARERVLEHLQLALAVSRRRDAAGGQSWPPHG